VDEKAIGKHNSLVVSHETTLSNKHLYNFSNKSRNLFACLHQFLQTFRA